MTLREFIEKLQEIGEIDPTRLDLEVRLFGSRRGMPNARYVSGNADGKVGLPYINVWDAS